MDSRGVAYLVLCNLTIGGFGVTSSILSAAGVSPFSQTFWRFLFAAAIFISVALALYGREVVPRKNGLVIMAVAGGLMILASLTYIGAIAVGVPVPVVSFLSEMSVMFTVLLAVPLLHEPLTRTKLMVIALGIGGVALISQPWTATQGNLTGELLVLVNAIAFALLTIFNSEYIKNRRTKPQLVSTWMFTGAALWSLPLLAFGAVQAPAGLSADEPWLLVTMAFFFTFVAYSLMNLGLKTIGAGSTSLISLLSPVSSTMLSYVVLGEVLGVFSGIGCALIVLGVLILALTDNLEARRRIWHSGTMPAPSSSSS